MRLNTLTSNNWMVLNGLAVDRTERSQGISHQLKMSSSPRSDIDPKELKNIKSQRARGEKKTKHLAKKYGVNEHNPDQGRAKI